MSDPHEVLHLTIEVVEMQILWRKEICFGSDHKVFSKTSWKESPGDPKWQSNGWMPVMAGNSVAQWGDQGALEDVAKNATTKGWRAEWHPEHGKVSKQFYREVKL